MALANKLHTHAGASTSNRRSVARPAFQAARSSRCVCNPRQRSSIVVAVAATEHAQVELSNMEQDPSLLDLPAGYHWYETMMVLRPTLNDEERDKELAKFEAFLNKEECMSINALTRGRSRMAYPIKNNWEGIYVLYTYAAKRQTARTVQLLLSTPEAGSEDNVLRHITFCKY